MAQIPPSRRRILAAMAAATRPSTDQLRQLLEPPAAKCQVVIDTDTYNEIDDQYAVAYGILSPDRLEVEAVYAAPYLNNRSTSAGDGMERSYEEILRILTRHSRNQTGGAMMPAWASNY